jgi:multiple sugar transport system permease protein
MPFRVFLAFVGPSVVAMLLLIAVPLGGAAYLSVWNSYTKTTYVETEVRTPLGVRKEQRLVPERDAAGNPVEAREFYGLRHYETVVGKDRLSEAFAGGGPAAIAADQPFLTRFAAGYRLVTNVAFWGALEFTLIYTLVTTPLVLALGFLVAVGVNSLTGPLKGPVIFASLLPFIVTPVVGSLSIKWLFLDNAVITAALQSLGFGKIYFLKDSFTIRSLIILVGVWKATPFAFIVLYAGLQTVAQEHLEAAVIDGATRWQRMTNVIIPHLSPLFLFIALIHLMDSYRVFEPILVFSGGQGANSLQYLTFAILNDEQNFHKAAAAALLTILGILVLLVPLIVRTYRDQRRAFA